MRRSARTAAWLALQVAVFLLLWEAVIRVFQVRPIMLPSPGAVLQTAIVMKGVLLQAAGYTLAEAVAGGLAGTLLGLALAVTFVYLEPLERGLFPFFVASQAVPIVAFSAIVVMWVGSGPLANVAIAAYIAFFPVVVNMVHGLRACDPEAVNLMRAYGATEREIFWKLRVPTSLPHFFVAVKLSATFGLVGAIVGDFFGGTTGVGAILVTALYAEETAKLLLGILMAAVLGRLMFGAVSGLDRAVVWWHDYEGHRQEVI